MTEHPSDRSNDSGSWAADPRAMRVGELLNEFMDRRASGEGITPEAFLSAHPEYASDLSSHFEGLGLLSRLSAKDDGTVALPEGTPASGGLFVGSHKHAPAPLPEIEGYELLRQVGRGGMGVVYKAKQKSTQRIVAIKLLLDGVLASEQNRRRFEREVALAAQLRHPNIIPIYDSGSADGRLFFVMDYVHGAPLNHYLRDHLPDTPSRLRMFTRVCRAIIHAHQRGVVHRDIKPSNVLVDANGEPHLLDFGLAKAGSMQDVTLSITAQLVGTPAYMSPEQVSGDPSEIDTRTDVYSLGVVLYEMLTEAAPYDVHGTLSDVLNNIARTEPRPPSSVNRKIGDEIDTIVLKALAKNKDERYQSVAELTSDIERYLSGDPIQARKPSPIYLLGKIIQRNSLYAAMIGGLSIAMVIVVALGVANYRSNEQLRLIKEQQALQEKRMEALLQQVSMGRLEQLTDRIGEFSPEVSKQIADNVMKKMTPEMLNSRNPVEFAAQFLLEELGARPAASQPNGSTAGTVTDDNIEPSTQPNAGSDWTNPRNRRSLNAWAVNRTELLKHLRTLFGDARVAELDAALARAADAIRDDGDITTNG